MPFDAVRATQSAQQSSIQHQRAFAQQNQDTARRFNAQMQTDRQRFNQQIQQQREANQWGTRRPSGAPGAAPMSTPPNVPGGWRHRLFILLATLGLAAGGILLAVVISSTAGGSTPPPNPAPWPLLPNPGGIAPSFATSGVVSGTPTTVLRVRSGPSTNADIIDRLQPGQPVFLSCQTNDGWDLLTQPDAGAYVLDRYIMRSADLPTC
jgi:hypothetical protein